MSVESIEPSGLGEPVWRLPWFTVLLAGAVAALTLWLFWDGISFMWSAWVGTPEYSHAILVPPVAAFLIWQQKDRLERIAFVGSGWGVMLVVLGGAMLVLGQLATIYTLVQYAYLVTLAGLVLSFTGMPAFRLLAVPLLILVFMIPLPQFLANDLSLKLQLVSSEFGVWLMHLCGVSVYAEGNVIDLGVYKLQVAEACSGLRYLFPLMTVGFLMAYFYRGAAWKRLVVFFSSIPITLVMNSVRVGTIGIMVEHWGIGMAEGFLHEFQGWAVFMLCAGLMIGEIVVLNGLGREAGSWRQLFGVEFPAPTPRDAVLHRRRVPPSFIGAAAVLLTFVVVAVMLPRPAEIIPARANFAAFPMQLGGWSGRAQALEGVYLETLKLDDYLLADYAGEGGRINLYMAYYNSQRKGEAVHSPRSCLPGGGWELKDFAQRTLPDVRINGQPLRVNRTSIVLGNQRQLVYYWFQQRGRVVSNEFAVKWYLFLDALMRHRTDGALVRIILPVVPGADEREADRSLTDFASRIATELPRYVPN